MFPSNGERTTIVDRGVEVGEPQAGHRKGKEKKERNWREGEIELLSAYWKDRACLWNVAHGDHINSLRQKGSGLLSNRC